VFATVAAAWLVLLLAAVARRDTDQCMPLMHATMMASLALVAIGEAHPTHRVASFSNEEFCAGLATLAFTTPMFLLARHQAKQRRRDKVAGHVCLACGYDLRATPHRCPECGTPAAPAAVTG
jgi:rubrerythrin